LRLDAPEDKPQEAHSALDVTYAAAYYPGTSDPSSASPLTLKPGDHAAADFNLVAVPALQIRIHVAGPGAQPFGANLEQRLGEAAVPAPFQQQGTRRDASGGQQVVLSGVAPGQYTLAIRSFGDHPGHWMQALNLTADVDLTVPPESPSVAVTGVLKSAGGWPRQVRPALRLRNVATGEDVAAQVAENGEFDFQGQSIHAGSYEVSVVNLRGAAVSNVMASGAKASGDIVAFSGAGPVQLQVLASRALAEVNGTALRDTTPVSGAMIVLIPEDFQNHVQLLRRDQSDSDGTFSLRNVLPGKYTVLAIQNGWDLEWQTAGALTPYLAKGSVIEVGGEGQFTVKVQVQ
jgi:hypothetical protein